MTRKTVSILVVALLVLAGGGAFYVWKSRRPAPPPLAVAVVEPVPPSVIASAPAEPEIKYPVPAAASAAAGEPTLAGALNGLLGRAAVQRFLQLDNFVPRLVTTVDNLPREQAPARLWPVQPTPGRFTPAVQGQRKLLGPENTQRYGAFVRWIETVDTARAVALYLQSYPQFQQAYVELGYPRGYFNDRMVEVIDHLLQTPEPAGDVELVMTEVKGPQQPARPWLLYEFADPALAARSAGQQTLLRMGNEQARRVKVKLREVRVLLAGSAGTR